MGVFGRQKTITQPRGEERVDNEFSFHVSWQKDNPRKNSCDKNMRKNFAPRQMDTINALKAKKLNESVFRQVTKVAQDHKDIHCFDKKKTRDMRKSDGALIDIMGRPEFVTMENKVNSKRNSFYPPDRVKQMIPDYDHRFYSVTEAQKCHHLLNAFASKWPIIKINLYPEEEWACNSLNIQWSIKLNKWWKKFCTIKEKSGSKIISTIGKITQNRDGSITIVGKFKRQKDADFKLHLSARISQQDFQNGYAMTGYLQQGDAKVNDGMHNTHFAAVARHQT